MSETNHAKPLEVRTRAAEVRAEGDENSRLVSGRVMRYGDRAHLGDFEEEFAVGAFADSLAQEERNVRFLYHHQAAAHLASTRAGSLTVDDGPEELRFAAEVVETTAGNDLLTLVRKKECEGVSFGFHMLDEQWNMDPATDRPVRTILRAVLAEVTATPIQAYSDSTIDSRSEGPIDDSVAAKARQVLADHAAGKDRPEHRARARRLREQLAGEQH